jgi:hypothetical protein
MGIQPISMVATNLPITPQDPQCSMVNQEPTLILPIGDEIVDDLGPNILHTKRVIEICDQCGNISHVRCLKSTALLLFTSSSSVLQCFAHLIVHETAC